MSDVASQGRSEGSEADFVALAPGQKIGRYEILAILGQGGFGITYRARDTQLNRDVAIKEYLPTALAVRQGGTTVLPRSTKVAEDFAWGRQRFVDEGRTLATLQRAPAIVRVFDFLEANGTAYIVMELVPGNTLESRLRHGDGFGPAEIDRILWPLLDGMERVHATGFLHRDIKPANILLSAEGRPTLIDFGASRVAVAGKTAAMTAIFTPGYAAAEQFTSAKQGPWTDIYGISATIYHAIAGSPPPSAFDRMLSDDYKALVDLQLTGFAPALLAGLDNGLAVRASERPQTIAEWRAILQGTRAPIAGVMEQPPTAAPEPPLAAVPARAGRGLWIGVAVAVVLLLAGGGYFFLSRPAGESLSSYGASASKEEEAKRLNMAREIERLRADKEARDKAEAEAKQLAEERRQIEEATRRKIEAEAAQAEKQRLEDEARKKAEAETKPRLLEPAPAALPPVNPYNGVYTGAAIFPNNRLPTSTHVTGGRGTGTWAVARCGPTATLTYVLTIDMTGGAKLDMQGFDQQCNPAPFTASGRVDNNHLVIAWGNLGAHLDLARTVADPDPAQGQAEASETALHLSTADRQHVQVALTSLGFNTNVTDGAFGPHTRDMIRAWQKARSQPVTGYLSGLENQALRKEAAVAIAKFDEATAQGVSPSIGRVPAAAAMQTSSAFDGNYVGQAFSGGGGVLPTSTRVVNGKGTGSWTARRCGATATVTYELFVDASGGARVETQYFDQQCGPKHSSVRARIENNMLTFAYGDGGGSVQLLRQRN